MDKKILIAGAVLGMLSIILGAFGAHGLKALISAEAVLTFETGVRYQMYHAFFLLIVGSTSFVSLKTKKVMYYLVLVGVVFFSGSIYGLATNTLSGFDFKSIGFVTPIGGLLLILAWGAMFADLVKNRSKNRS
ncbi:DUF423 domain-containing protein [Tamlana sp. 2_MG-2023]|uniref:DUF423 domain-containing protein n=1 Tax=unclassified Tamlana TaxID=2614803 RepID=UPI0026E3A100|nr:MULTISPECIES: DUF423 domain-containing protein [unclassified Tamlana]MDO6760625.1 DUF423 domain-containing protein [Tamlana sp. 2_MG-2023]MDO6790881.1 DUF423 domain-containing protein [Tamlana sp. 1_MG-2023]